MHKLLLPLAVVLLSLGAHAQAPAAKPTLQDFAWLAGHWRIEQGDRVIDEHWMAPAAELAVVLLAILKAGGCYTWSDPGPGAAATIWFEGPGGQQYEVEIGEVPLAAVCGSSNLPVMTRETDAACVLQGEVVVPHATIIGMASCASGARSPFSGEPGAFDLWVPLMNGATAVVEERSAVAA